MVDGNGDRVVGGYVPDLESGSNGNDRLEVILRGAIEDLSASLAAGHQDTIKLPLVLSVAEPRPGFSAEAANALGDRLVGSTIGGIQISKVHLRPFGHAAGLESLGFVAQEVARGKIDAMLVAGVDSYFHADTVDWLESHRQLMNATNRSAFVPGEGAGVCLVGSSDFARSLSLKAQNCVLGFSRSEEPAILKSRDVCIGLGMSEAISMITQPLNQGERISAIVSDQNGERYRSDEWGFMALRHGVHFDDVTDYLAPAAWWGDMGAASGPLFASLTQFDGALDTKPRTLLAASSEGGLRASVLLGPLQEQRVAG